MPFGFPPFSAGLVPSFQILDNHQVACGLKLGSAAPVPAKPRFLRGEEGILNQNSIFQALS